MILAPKHELVVLDNASADPDEHRGLLRLQLGGSVLEVRLPPALTLVLRVMQDALDEDIRRDLPDPGFRPGGTFAEEYRRRRRNATYQRDSFYRSKRRIMNKVRAAIRASGKEIALPVLFESANGAGTRLALPGLDVTLASETEPLSA